MQDVEKLLNRCRDYPRDMEKMYARRLRYLDAATRCGGSDCTGGRSSDISNIPERYAAQVDAVDREIEERQKEYAQDVAAATAILDGMTLLHAQVLHRYYIACESVKGVASSLHYSESHIRRTLALALAEANERP